MLLDGSTCTINWSGCLGLSWGALSFDLIRLVGLNVSCTELKYLNNHCFQIFLSHDASGLIHVCNKSRRRHTHLVRQAFMHLDCSNVAQKPHAELTHPKRLLEHTLQTGGCFSRAMWVIPSNRIKASTSGNTVPESVGCVNAANKVPTATWITSALFYLSPKVSVSRCSTILPDGSARVRTLNSCVYPGFSWDAVAFTWVVATRIIEKKHNALNCTIWIMLFCISLQKVSIFFCPVMLQDWSMCNNKFGCLSRLLMGWALVH